ncbi:MAG: bifunctional adenosylcobinamide kinase/adenosylcobinamide-phosphate guanylyltransferase [Oscillospiraceae bacterium]|nr:bifunctional adenosylcobinamide kinase/adenosylcobinamide-phosphate guanylyltransferase [Oscillospiraceae bacterium]
MRIFVSGGCKNGKSFYAQRLAKSAAGRGGQPAFMYYVATMRPVDSEDDERIKRHRDERDGWGFTTIEQPVRIEEILEKCDKRGCFLLDSLTALLAEEMFPPEGSPDELAADRVIAGLTQVLEAIGNIVVVSDYIYGDAMFFDPLTESYRRSLAKIDRAAAKLCDVVLEISYAGVIVHKGGDMFNSGIYDLRDI